MTAPLAESMWTCIWNIFTPFWSISKASGEAGPAGHGALEAYVQRPDTHQWRKLLRVMQPERRIERAVVVGQRGAGKSMDLAWLAYELSQTHVVFWIDAVEQSNEVLYAPLGLFVAIASAVHEGARQMGCQPDKKLFEAFLSTCLDTMTREQVADLPESVSQLVIPVGLATANPIFVVAGNATALVAERLSDQIESSAGKRDSWVRSRTSTPRASITAARLTTFVQNVVKRCNRSIVVIVDGLDRVEDSQLTELFQCGRDLARPELRLILTAPLVSYATPEFDQLVDYFPHVILSPNVESGNATSEGRRFLRNVVERRLGFCGKTQEEIFKQASLEQLLDASGGNVRQLIMLIRQASLEAELGDSQWINEEIAQAAINHVKAGLVASLRDQELQALEDFYQQDGLKVLPSAPLGSTLLRRKWILAYAERGLLRYALNPLVQAYLSEEGVI